MKSKILPILLSLLCFAAVPGVCQYITSTNTPNGTPVYGVAGKLPITSTEALMFATERSQRFPNALSVRPAANQYNCGGFAWHMSNGASSNKNVRIWIDPNAWTPYLPTNQSGDGSYARQTGGACSGCKIEYVDIVYTPVHVGVIYSLSGGTTGGPVAVSKWGRWELLRHDIWDTPYLETYEYRYYYRQGYAGSAFSLSKTETKTGCLLHWEVNGQVNNIEGFNVIKKDPTASSAVNEQLIARKSSEEIAKAGEKYEYQIGCDGTLYQVEIVYADGTREILDSKE